MDKLLTITPSPHIKQGDSVNKIMYSVIFALAPALVWSFFIFGLSAVVVTLTSVVSCVVIEWLIQKYVMNVEPSVKDGSAILTGILLAMNVPAGLPLWIMIIGAIVAIGVGKMSFGGLGHNPFNPALVGRVFLLISFPVQMTTWPNVTKQVVDATSEATPLALVKEGVNSGSTVPEIMQQLPNYNELLLGNFSGSLGEMSAALLLLGMVYMLIRKVITWHIPVTIIATVFVFTGILYLVDPMQYADPLFHLLSGGLMLGAIYMATDMVSSPMAKKGQIIYALGIGLITVSIRIWGAYPEGISFAILIMNAFTPLINNYVKPKRFGEKKNG
ncbi:MAG: RnfABCDGE type electron transport complex subunit D [Prolixibacteraceae bacterium]|jgi:electron transport complex protein RnfD|nr:RnfABCDGE type electron transport complex subunit D [Prolixibacteraceae bacterium]